MTEPPTFEKVISITSFLMRRFEFYHKLKNLDVVYTRRDFDLNSGIFTQLGLTPSETALN